MIILFGATGDLAKKKLLPALFSLHRKGELKMPLLCIGRRELSKEGYVKELGLQMFEHDPNYQSFLKQLHYLAVSLDGDPTEFKKLVAKFKGTSQMYVYLAISPELFTPTVKFLKRSNILDTKTRIAFEKPFGRDLRSAVALDKSLRGVFGEKQIYRVDHYLGKDLVDNMLTMRFANRLFESLWSAKDIENVQIVLSEDVGVEGRGGYYDTSGAIRDMVQNHIVQLISLVAMEPPKDRNAEAIRDAKVAVVKRLEPVTSSELVIGQYRGYLSEEEVATGSRTETFVAFKTGVKTPRWKGVPFYVKTGKKLAEKYSEINLVLKRGSKLFASDNNVISIRLGPKQEGIALQTLTKMPGTAKDTHTSTLEFCYKCEFGPNSAESYERILHELFTGNHARFTRSDELLESWKFTDALIRKAKNAKLHQYAAGTEPQETQRLIKSGWVRVARKLTI